MARGVCSGCGHSTRSRVHHIKCLGKSLGQWRKETAPRRRSRRAARASGGVKRGKQYVPLGSSSYYEKDVPAPVVEVADAP